MVQLLHMQLLTLICAMWAQSNSQTRYELHNGLEWLPTQNQLQDESEDGGDYCSTMRPHLYELLKAQEKQLKDKFEDKSVLSKVRLCSAAKLSPFAGQVAKKFCAQDESNSTATPAKVGALSEGVIVALQEKHELERQLEKITKDTGR